MPYKDKVRQREYQKTWVRQKRQGSTEALPYPKKKGALCGCCGDVTPKVPDPKGLDPDPKLPIQDQAEGVTPKPDPEYPNLERPKSFKCFPKHLSKEHSAR